MESMSFLRSFVMVAEQRSFAKTARKLSTTQPAISKRVAQLEEMLQVQLLNRTTRQISLTPAGREFYHRCKTLLKEWESIKSTTANINENAQGLIRVGTDVNVCSHYISVAANEFLSEHAQLKISLQLLEREQHDFDFQNIDVFIGRHIGGNVSSLKQRRIFTYQNELFASPSYLKKQGKPKKLSDLPDNAFLVSTRDSYDGFLEFANDIRLPITRHFKTNDLYSLVMSAINGVGVIYLPRQLVSSQLEQGQLEPILPEYTSKPIGIYAIYPNQRYIPKKLMLLLDHLQKQNDDGEHEE